MIADKMTGRMVERNIKRRWRTIKETWIEMENYHPSYSKYEYYDAHGRYVIETIPRVKYFWKKAESWEIDYLIINETPNMLDEGSVDFNTKYIYKEPVKNVLSH